MTIPRWTAVVVAAILVVAMLIWARGDEHHRGDEVGAVSQALR